MASSEMANPTGPVMSFFRVVRGVSHGKLPPPEAACERFGWQATAPSATPPRRGFQFRCRKARIVSVVSLRVAKLMDAISDAADGHDLLNATGGIVVGLGDRHDQVHRFGDQFAHDSVVHGYSTIFINSL